MQRLIILRHARAVSWQPGVEDFPRTLTDIGREHASRIAEWIGAQPRLPDEILCSPAQRTRETLAPLLALRPELESRTSFVPQIYGASTRTLTTLLDRAFTERDCVLMVGHNPGFERLAFEVVGPSERHNFERLPTGTLMVVEFEQGWPEDSDRGRLAHLIRGETL